MGSQRSIFWRHITLIVSSQYNKSYIPLMIPKTYDTNGSQKEQRE
jgi:hypothetical protein